MAKVRELGVPLVELTGGEPLAQKEAFTLVDRLIQDGFEVLIETGGSEPIANVHEKAQIIMDINVYTNLL